MRVRHLGNTANNAFHNAQLLAQYAGIESELPAAMFGLRHAISAPAWDGVDFEVPNAQWVVNPDWSLFPDAVAVNERYSDIVTVAPAPAEGDAPAERRGPADLVAGLRTRVFGPLRGQAWAQPIVEMRDRQLLAQRPLVPEDAGHVTLLYGSSSLFSSQVTRPAQSTICIEHGTVRWIADGAREEKAFRDAYRDQVREAPLVWLTNLDTRTLEIVEDVAPGHWAALPHPFIPDERVPFAESASRRRALLEQTDSDFLIVLPASQNWSKHHDKGSLKALNAFVELRRGGHRVGLVAIEWGHQLAESREFLESAGVGSNVVWLPPMPRFPLQRMMANADVVWDQFGVDFFGALALRVVEQGTPLVSRGIPLAAQRLMGGDVPWLPAQSIDEIVRQTSSVLDAVEVEGRDAVISRTRAHYRGWLASRHSPAITAALQAQVFSALRDGGFDRRNVVADEWARWIDSNTEGSK